MYSPGTLICKGGLLLGKDPSCCFGLCFRAILNFGETVANCVGHLDVLHLGFVLPSLCIVYSVVAIPSRKTFALMFEDLQSDN
jgi:hypothetical protein